MLGFNKWNEPLCDALWDHKVQRSLVSTVWKVVHLSLPQIVYARLLSFLKRFLYEEVIGLKF